MAKQISPLFLAGGAVALYLLLKPSAPVTSVPGSIVQPTGSILSTLLTTQSQVVTTYGINSGVRGGNGSFYTCSNYATLLQYNPNLGNPSYQMSAGENTQYLANYSDLQQGLSAWVGHKVADGSTPANINQAAQAHWKIYGCAEKRIFLPLQPPSTAAFVPPPVNTQAASSSGSSWVGTALQVAGTVAVALLGTDSQVNDKLTDAEVNFLITGSAIAKNILPFYLQVDPNLVGLINNKIDKLLSQYAN